MIARTAMPRGVIMPCFGRTQNGFWLLTITYIVVVRARYKVVQSYLVVHEHVGVVEDAEHAGHDVGEWPAEDDLLLRFQRYGFFGGFLGR